MFFCIVTAAVVVTVALRDTIIDAGYLGDSQEGHVRLDHDSNEPRHLISI